MNRPMQSDHLLSMSLYNTFHQIFYCKISFNRFAQVHAKAILYHISIFNTLANAKSINMKQTTY